MQNNQSDNQYRRPWYKHWWVWVSTILIILACFGGSGSGGSSKSSSSKSASSSSSSSAKTVKPAQNTAQEKTLGAGTFKVGHDLKPGRYQVTATSGSGNFTNESGSINTILGQNVDNQLGQVTSYTVDLYNGETIKLRGIQSTDFKPTPSNRTYQTTLSAGDWKVGKDIKPGHYVIKAVQGSGNVITDDGEVDEILGTKADKNLGQVTQVTVDLSSGQTLHTGLQQIQLIKQ